MMRSPNTGEKLYWSYRGIIGALETVGWVSMVVLRVSVGFMFLTGAIKKLSALEMFTQMFTRLGIPMASLAAPAVAWIELIGGAALMFGLATRFVSVMLAVDMIGALFTDIGPDIAHHHPEVIDFASNLFYSSEWLLVGLLFWLTGVGAGRFSLDCIIGERVESIYRRNLGS